MRQSTRWNKRNDTSREVHEMFKNDEIGQTGGNDYSKWKYRFTPAYAGTIREGINGITAKLLCEANPANLTKFYSINVTGMNGIVPKQSSAITRSNTSVAPLSSNSSSSLFYETPLINQLSHPTNSNSSISSDCSSSHHNGMSSHHYHSMENHKMRSIILHL
jgi:hypothetical protein